MKFDIAVITTEGATSDFPLPVSMQKVIEVSNGVGNFSCAQDAEIAKWILQISKVLSLR